MQGLLEHTGRETGRQKDARRALRQMKQLLLAFRGQMDEQLRPQGATTAQVQMLYQMSELGTSTGARLARSLNVTPQTIQTMLARSEGEGWVQRGRDGENDRLVMWSLTVAGDGLLQEAEVAFNALQKRLWRGFTAKSLHELNGVLAQCLANLDR